MDYCQHDKINDQKIKQQLICRLVKMKSKQIKIIQKQNREKSKQNIDKSKSNRNGSKQNRDNSILNRDKPKQQQFASTNQLPGYFMDLSPPYKIQRDEKNLSEEVDQFQQINSKLDWKQFQNSIHNFKLDATYRILIDIHNIYSHKYLQTDPQLDRQSNHKKQLIKKQLIDNYLDTINKIDQQLSSIRILYFKQQIQQNHKQQISDQIDQQQMRTLDRLKVQQTLNTQLKTAILNLQKFIEAVFIRIQHQKYLQNQNQIDAYIHRQKDIFADQRGQIQKIIRDHNQNVSEVINIAKRICQQKQAEINRLEQYNSNTQNQIKNDKESILNLTQKQHQLGKDIAHLDQRILQIKAERRAKLRSMQKKCQNQSSDQSQLVQNHLESSIHPRKNSSSKSMSEIRNQSTNGSIKCQIAASDFKTQLWAKSVYIFAAAIFGTIVFLW